MAHSTKRSVQDIAEDIMNDVEHGECFYGEKQYESFVRLIVELKTASRNLYNENKKHL